MNRDAQDRGSPQANIHRPHDLARAISQKILVLLGRRSGRGGMNAEFAILAGGIGANVVHRLASERKNWMFQDCSMTFDGDINPQRCLKQIELLRRIAIGLLHERLRRYRPVDSTINRSIRSRRK